MIKMYFEAVGKKELSSLTKGNSFKKIFYYER